MPITAVLDDSKYQSSGGWMCYTHVSEFVTENPVMYNPYSFDFRRDLKSCLCPVCPVWNSIPILFLYGIINH